MEILASIGNALHMAFAMFWEILWALILGFFLSATVQAVVSKSEMKRLLPVIRRDRSRSRLYWRGFFIVLVRGGRTGPINLSKGR